MTAGLYFDHNIHGDIVKGLLGRSVDCLTPEADGRDGLADEPLLDRAIDRGRVMVSNDEDMLKIAKARLSNGGPPG